LIAHLDPLDACAICTLLPRDCARAKACRFRNALHAAGKKHPHSGPEVYFKATFLDLLVEGGLSSTYY